MVFEACYVLSLSSIPHTPGRHAVLSVCTSQDSSLSATMGEMGDFNQVSDRGWSVKNACRVLVILICLVSGVWMTGCVFWGTVSGTVTHEDGSPAVGAEVLARRDPNLGHLTYTDSAGRYVFGRVQAGAWRIIVEPVSPSDDPVVSELTVNASQDNVLNIRLPY
jgi:hypothetical protein